MQTSPMQVGGGGSAFAGNLNLPIQQFDPMGGSAKMIDLLNGMNQNKLFQETLKSNMGINDAAKGAVGPNGLMDNNAFTQSVAGNKNITLGAPQAFAQGLEQQAKQLENARVQLETAMKRNAAIGGAVGAVLAKGPNNPNIQSDVAGAVGKLASDGTLDLKNPADMNAATAFIVGLSGKDPAEQTKILTDRVKQAEAAFLRASGVHRALNTVDNGAGQQQQWVDPVTGEVTNVGRPIENMPGPSVRNPQITRTDEYGRTITSPAGYASTLTGGFGTPAPGTGRVDPAPAVPKTPDSAAKQPYLTPRTPPSLISTQQDPRITSVGPTPAELNTTNERAKQGQEAYENSIANQKSMGEAAKVMKPMFDIIQGGFVPGQGVDFRLKVADNAAAAYSNFISIVAPTEDPAVKAEREKNARELRARILSGTAGGNITSAEDAEAFGKFAVQNAMGTLMSGLQGAMGSRVNLLEFQTYMRENARTGMSKGSILQLFKRMQELKDQADEKVGYYTERRSIPRYEMDTVEGDWNKFAKHKGYYATSEQIKEEQEKMIPKETPKVKPDLNDPKYNGGR